MYYVQWKYWKNSSRRVEAGPPKFRLGRRENGCLPAGRAPRALLLSRICTGLHWRCHQLPPSAALVDRSCDSGTADRWKESSVRRFYLVLVPREIFKHTLLGRDSREYYAWRCARPVSRSAGSYHALSQDKLRRPTLSLLGASISCAIYLSL